LKKRYKQKVEQLQHCGKIYYESKLTKEFQREGKVLLKSTKKKNKIIKQIR